MKSKTQVHNGNRYAVESGGDGDSSSSQSPAPSPGRDANISRCRRRPRSKSFSRTTRHLGSFAAGIIARRNLRYFFFVPLVYISGLLVCMAPFSALIGHAPLPGSRYRSHEIFQKLWPEIESDNSSAVKLSSVWKYKRKLREKPWPNLTAVQHEHFESPGRNGILIVEANGGLNDQRFAISNAVAVAGLLNALLVVPHFEFHNVWKDPSEFGDIYDEDHFISTLEGYVKVVKELPEVLMERYNYNISNITNIRVQAWAPVSFYLGEVYPVLQKEGVIQITPFANRLAMSAPPHIQFLRCLTNYKALRFSSSISMLSKKLVNQMIEKSSRADGKYIAVHLRFEEDYSSQLAALDYTVCLFSEVFVTTQGGNFPHFLMGHRRFLYDVHAKTICPDKRRLVVLLDDIGIGWRAFKEQMEDILGESDSKGIMVPRVRKINRKTSVYT